MVEQKIPANLQKVFTNKGIILTGKSPAPDCTAVGPGFCSEKGCHILSTLINQAERSGIHPDHLADRLTSATEDYMTDWVPSVGCNVLTHKTRPKPTP